MDSWLIWRTLFERFLIIEVGALWLDVLHLWLSSVESSVFSILYLLGLWAAFGPFQHMCAVWSFLWQCGWIGCIFVLGLSVDCLASWSFCSLLFWHVLVFCSIGNSINAVMRVVIECVCSLLLLLLLPSWEKIIVHLFWNHSTHILVLKDQLFDRMCPFLNKLSFLTFRRVGVFLRITVYYLLCRRPKSSYGTFV